MKNLLSVFVFFIIAPLSAQTYKDEKKMVQAASLDSSNEQLNFLMKNSENKGFSLNQGNSVFIQQAGQENVANVFVSSDDSQINLQQEGFQNKSVIFLRADVIRENVIQRGDQNFFLDYSLHGAKSHTVNLLQDGNYNEVISVGKNSISERLQLNQTGIGKRAFIIHN